MYTTRNRRAEVVPVRMAEILNDIRKALKCPGCQNSMRPPIYHCVNGHGLCGDCRNRPCPRCNEPIVNKRNNLAEAMVEHLPFPCLNAKLGCPEFVVLEDTNAHQLKCLHFRCQCLVLNEWTDARLYDCPWKEGRCQLRAHTLGEFDDGHGQTDLYPEQATYPIKAEFQFTTENNTFGVHALSSCFWICMRPNTNPGETALVDFFGVRYPERLGDVREFGLSLELWVDGQSKVTWNSKRMFGPGVNQETVRNHPDRRMTLTPITLAHNALHNIKFQTRIRITPN